MAVFTIPSIKQIEREKEEIFGKMTFGATATDYYLLLGGKRGYHFRKYYKNHGIDTIGSYWLQDEEPANSEGDYWSDDEQYESRIEKSSYVIR